MYFYCNVAVRIVVYALHVCNAFYLGKLNIYYYNVLFCLPHKV